MAGVPVLFQTLARSETRPAARVADVPARAAMAIVGGGVIGLMVGWRLARRGLAVAIFDAGTMGGGTSSAATGMLAAGAEHEPGGDALLGLARESLDLWPAFRDALEAESGFSIDYGTKGTLVVAIGRDEVERLRARYRLQIAAGLDARWMMGSAVRDLEPGLRPTVTAGILCPGDHQVDPPRVLAALRQAALAAGATLVEGATVERLDSEGGRIVGVVVDGRLCRAETVVIATGAVAGSDGLLPEHLRLPLRPLKGQSLALRARPVRGRAGAGGNLGLPIEHVVWTAEVHLAPKADGRLIVGATVEEAGFDPHLTAGGLYALLDGVRRVLPGVEEMAVETAWAGYRPTTEDDAPVDRSLPACRGWRFALGHHRNGYLLAPVTAQAIEDLVVSGRRPRRGPKTSASGGSAWRRRRHPHERQA